jgi:hypothetical protein
VRLAAAVAGYATAAVPAAFAGCSPNLQLNFTCIEHVLQLHAAGNHGIIGPLKFLADHTESFLLNKVNMGRAA